MSKSAEFMRLISIILLSILLLGSVYFLLTFATHAFFKPSSAPAPTHTAEPAAPFSEYASLRREYERGLEKSIESALAKVAGPGAVKASVRAVFDLQQESSAKNLLVPNSSVVRATTLAEKGSDGTGNDLYEQTTQYDFSTHKIIQNKTFENVERLSVTVLIDGHTSTTNGQQIYRPRSKTDMQTYEKLVQSIIGYTPTRGDVLEVINLPFTETTPHLFGLPMERAISLIIFTVLSIVALILLLFFILPMMRSVTAPPMPEKPSRLPAATEKSPIAKVAHLFDTHPAFALKILRAWLYQKPKSATEKSGLWRAAVLLLALGEDNIKRIFHQLTDIEITAISRSMGELGRIPADIVDSIALSFLRNAKSPPELIGTYDQTSRVLKNTLPREKAAEVLREIDMKMPGRTAWDKLANLSTDALVPFLERETPAVIAVILCQLPNDKAGAILSGMRDNTRAAVVKRLSDLGPVDADTLRAIEQGLDTQLQTFFAHKDTRTGKEKLAQILGLLDKESTDAFLKPLYDSAPDTARQISDHIFNFERLAKWDDTALQTLLKAADKDTIVLALKGASDDIKDAFSRNMTPRVWAELMRDVAHLGAVRISQIDTAQRTILRLAQDLINARKITPKG